MAKTIIDFFLVDVLKKVTSIDNNIEDKSIYSNIQEAQNMDLQPILGTKLFKALQDKVSGDTLDGNYKILMDDYIFDYLVYQTLRRSLPFMDIKIKNSGYVQLNGTNFQTVSDRKLNEIKSEYSNRSEFYSNRLKDHLYYNNTLYPEYITNTEDDIIPDTKERFFGGLIW